MPPPALQMHAITKRFGSVLALDTVDFELVPGEIHALLGENGAGKSTLMNILRGLLPPTSGTIVLGGKPLQFTSPQDAARAGIGMVHQHFLLVPTFTVAENLALASPEKHPPLAHAAEVARRLGWSIPLNARIADLPVGTQQRVEILKALLGDARILLFDEPTAVLAPNEIGELFTVLRALRAEGRSLVFVSHKLNEVMALCDRVTVLRRGRLVGTVAVSETSLEDLARRMIGPTFPAALGSSLKGGLGTEPSVSMPHLPFREDPARSLVIKQGSRFLLSVTDLTTDAQADAVALRDISFQLQPGETLGFAG